LPVIGSNGRWVGGSVLICSRTMLPTSLSDGWMPNLRITSAIDSCKATSCRNLAIDAALDGLVRGQGLAGLAFRALAIVLVPGLEVLRRDRARSRGDDAGDARSLEHVADPEHGEADDQQTEKDHREGRFGEGAETGEHDLENLPDLPRALTLLFGHLAAALERRGEREQRV
jgi:hypothetical protein